MLNVVSALAKWCEVKAFSPFKHFCFECQYDKVQIKFEYINPTISYQCMNVCFCSY